MLPFSEPGGNAQTGESPNDTTKQQQSASASDKRTPSSSTEGFFQQPPLILNPLIDDLALQSALALYVPRPFYQQLHPSLLAFGEKVMSKPILNLVADAEHNPPYLKTWDAWGRRKDELITSTGWRQLSAIGQAEGMVSLGYENQYGPISRPYMFIKYLAWAGSAAWTTCPNLMTDGVAALLRKHLTDCSIQGEQRKALQSAFDRVTSSDPDFAWTTGQWMTERQGGSDVSMTETLAEYAPDKSEKEVGMVGTDGIPLGSWLVNGFKWFSSATDSQMMVFLARTPNGISTFMAPMRRKHTSNPVLANGETTELNGVQIQQLKNKLGTRALPTAELVLKDVRAHLVGEEGKGVKEIATVLNIARVHNAMTAVGLWGRGLSIIRAFARVRKVGLKPLWSKAAFMRTLAKMHVEYRANVLFCTYVASLLGVIEQPQIEAYCNVTGARNAGKYAFPHQPSSGDIAIAETMFRLLASVLKGLTAKAAIAALAECMEGMGGVGYLENDDMQFNIARLYRDANVCSIWEGTTDMMAHDVLRVVCGKLRDETLRAMDKFVEGMLVQAEDLKREGDIVKDMWREWKEDVSTKERAELELRSRALMERLGDVVMGVLLVLDAGRTTTDEIAKDVLQAWLESRGHGDGAGWQYVIERERHIVFGTEGPDNARAML